MVRVWVNILVTVCNSSYGKVMFSQACVKNSVDKGVSAQGMSARRMSAKGQWVASRGVPASRGSASKVVSASRGSASKVVSASRGWADPRNTGYGQQVGGTHPTKMCSCFHTISFLLWITHQQILIMWLFVCLLQTMKVIQIPSSSLWITTHFTVTLGCVGLNKESRMVGWASSIQAVLWSQIIGIQTAPTTQMNPGMTSNLNVTLSKIFWNYSSWDKVDLWNWTRVDVNNF